MKKKALIFGITGQDGSYLTRLLINKNYIVSGVIRRSSSFNTNRIDDIYDDKKYSKLLNLYYGDLTDQVSINKIINKVQPTEIYNLAAQSHVGVSFQLPEYSSNVNALGTLRILEAILNCKNYKKIKFYQAGTSEMFGASKPPQNEKTTFSPQSPYAIAKLYSHWITDCYRNAYGLFACNGILFNHESPQRGGTFVTKKIVKALCRILKNKQNKLYLGNLYSKRDWGHAKDYVFAMWKILQQKKPDDFVISTGKQYTVKQFINFTCKELGMKILWKGKGINEKAYYQGRIIIEIQKRFFRPNEVNSLLGSSKKAIKKLNWNPEYNIHDLIREMVNHELNILNVN